MATVVVVGSFAESLVNFRGPLLRAMIERGHRVIACAPDASPELQATLTAMQVSYRDIPIERAGLNPLRDAQTVQALLRLFQQERPEIVLAYTIKPVIYGSLAATIARVPKIFALITGLGYAFVGQTLKSRLINLVVRQLYRWSLSGSQHVFFQNPDDRQYFIQAGLVRPAQTVLVHGSGVDVEHFIPAPLPEKLSFLLVGRFLNEKGLREYIAAARQLKQTYPQLAFRLAGWLDNGNPASISEQELQSWIDEGIIEYLGKLDDVRPAIADCSVYVLPSYREGTPRTVLEAMAMSRPIITTDAPGCRETLVDGQNGFLVPVKDVVALTKAMERFILHPELLEPMGRASRQIAVEKYDVHQVNAVILNTMGLD